jgi:hypothetical protein
MALPTQQLVLGLAVMPTPMGLMAFMDKILLLMEMQFMAFMLTLQALVMGCVAPLTLLMVLGFMVIAPEVRLEGFMALPLTVPVC